MTLRTTVCLGLKKMWERCPAAKFLLLLLSATWIVAGSPWTLPLAHGQEMSFSGITEPVDEVTLSASGAGTISKIFFEEGETVRKGDVVIELDNRLEKFEVARRKMIWESKVEVKAAAAKVSTLKSMLEGTQELFETTGSISRDELERLSLEHELAIADLKRLELTEKRERLEYEMALENLRKRSVVTPIGGTVIQLYLKEGETTQEHQPLVRIVDTRKCIFVGNVEEWVGRRLRNGQSVDLVIKTGSDVTPVKGTISFISPVVDPASSLMKIKAEFDNEQGTVRPGVSGILRLKNIPAGDSQQQNSSQENSLSPDSTPSGTSGIIVQPESPAKS